MLSFKIFSKSYYALLTKNNGHFCILSACSRMNWPLPGLEPNRSLRLLSYSTSSTLKLVSSTCGKSKYIIRISDLA